MVQKLIPIVVLIIGMFFVFEALAVNTIDSGVFLEVDRFYDFGVEVVKGNVIDTSSVNKFGRATDIDSVNTDLWDRANPTQGQTIWLKPNASRYHSIVSSSTEDNPSGAGASNITIYGLTDWNTPEVSETITLSGTTAINTTRSYVIIHRMKVIGGYLNTGYITATAQTDGTITAQINPTQGQTLMAIYGIPSGYCLFVNKFYLTVLKATGSGIIDGSIKVNENPRNNLNAYLTKHTTSVSTSGGENNHDFIPSNKFCGPSIIKMQAIGSTVNLDASGGFDAYLIKQ